ncbi:ABC transporter permease [Thalassotalea aquiviva]|uniref:ABC transporter permease n=1 Tax=Thalassotalea aquiviva TaxID=3242415 RepID=UPI00352A6495
MWIKQSIRLFKHELKRGELTIICFAIMLAVATVFSLSGFSDKIQSALISESNSFIAADRVLQSSRPIDSKIIEKAEESNVQHAQQLLFSSMVFAGDNMLLSSVKAVSDAYPLRGELLVRTALTSDYANANAPKLGTVWVGQSLLNKLAVTIGDSIELGVAKFVIDGVIHQEPDASFSVFTQGPRVILNIADVAKTEVVQPGSRLTYKYLFAGELDNISQFEKWVKPQVQEYQRWRDIKGQQSPLANALTRAEKFLSLASMLGIILAAVAVSVASRRYAQRHQPMVAVFKAMGAGLSYIRNLYLLHWASLALFSIVVGMLIGYGLQQIALSYMAEYLPESANTQSMYPFVVAIFTGLICASAFAIAPMKELISTPALSVIRGFNGFSSGQTWLRYIPAFLAVFALLVLFSKDIFLSLVLMLCAGIAIVVLALFGHLLVNAGRKIGSGAGQSLLLAMANLKRRAKHNNVQLVSFTIAIMLLLMMLVVRNDLINDWQAQLPETAPNQFLVNINKQQVPQVESFLAENNMAASGLYPIVRGRLTAINEDVLTKSASKEEDDASEQGRRGIGRELNMTWRNELPNENKVVAGRWFEPNSTVAEVSIEQRLAERLDVRLGDNLTFQIGTEAVQLPVTSIREVNWQSMQPNFYMIFSQGVLSDFPATYIASVHVPQTLRDDMQQFLSQFPTISVIDVDALINQLRTVIGQVSLAIEFILALVLIAGSLVLVAQVQASMEERERELAILRTLGAKGSLLRNSTLLEFVVLGAISGFLASVVMEIAVYFVQTELFKIEPSWHFAYWALGIVSGALFVGILGLASCWRLLNLSSLTLIRRTL